MVAAEARRDIEGALMAGRPTKFTKKLGEQICMHMCEGMSVRKIAELDDMPAASTIFKWAIDPDHVFSEQYANARRIMVENLVEEITEISDDEGGDVRRDRLRVDTRKWFASKVAPKLYGDKVQHTGGDGEGPVQIVINESGQSGRSD